MAPGGVRLMTEARRARKAAIRRRARYVCPMQSDHEGTTPAPRPRRWATQLIDGQPRDVKLDAEGTPIAVADWIPPLELLRPDRCANCGGRRVSQDLDVTVEGGGVRDPSPACEGCGMNAREDWHMHMEITHKLRAGSFVEAADRAASMGQQVLSLKLATAGVHYGDAPDTSRRQRLRQLDAVGARVTALQEAALWLKETKADPEVARRVADVFVRCGLEAEALVALEDSVRLHPTSPQAYAELSRGLRRVGRFDDALRALRQVFELPEGRPHGERQLHKLLLALWEDHRSQAVISTFDALAPHSHRDADACALYAQALEQQGQAATARRWVQRALSLRANDPELLRRLAVLEEQLGVASTVAPVLSPARHEPE